MTLILLLQFSKCRGSRAFSVRHTPVKCTKASHSKRLLTASVHVSSQSSDGFIAYLYYSIVCSLNESLYSK